MLLDGSYGGYTLLVDTFDPESPSQPLTPEVTSTPVTTISSNTTEIVDPLSSRNGSDAINPLIKYSAAAGDKIVDQSSLSQYDQNNYLNYDSFVIVFRKSCLKFRITSEFC